MQLGWSMMAGNWSPGHKRVQLSCFQNRDGRWTQSPGPLRFATSAHHPSKYSYHIQNLPMNNILRIPEANGVSCSLSLFRAVHRVGADTSEGRTVDLTGHVTQLFDHDREPSRVKAGHIQEVGEGFWPRYRERTMSIDGGMCDPTSSPTHNYQMLGMRT